MKNLININQEFTIIYNYEFAEKLKFFRKLRGTVSGKATCYPAPSLTFTHLRSDLKKFEKLSFFDFFRILVWE